MELNKDKQIEEMANEISEMDEPNAHYYDETLQVHEAFADCFTIAKHLYEKGYRKASEVAREIFEDCHNTLIKVRGAVRDGLDKAIREGNEEAKLVHIGTEETVKCIILIFNELEKKYTEEGK